MNDTQVHEVMTNLVVTLRRDDRIATAARLLSSNRISGAPVVEGGRVVGVVSAADLLRAYAGRGRRVSAPPYALMFLLVRATLEPENEATMVGDVMTKKVVTVGPGDTVGRAAALLVRHGVRRLPVVDEGGYLVGIVARGDLVRCMADADDKGLAVAAEA